MAEQTFEEIAAAVKQAESGGKRYKDDGKTLTTSAKGALGRQPLGYLACLGFAIKLAFNVQY